MAIISYQKSKHDAIVRHKRKNIAETFETPLETQNFEQRKKSEILAISSKAVFDKMSGLTCKQASNQYFASSNFNLKRPYTQKMELVKGKYLNILQTFPWLAWA